MQSGVSGEVGHGEWRDEDADDAHPAGEVTHATHATSQSLPAPGRGKMAIFGMLACEGLLLIFIKSQTPMTIRQYPRVMLMELSLLWYRCEQLMQ